MKRLISLILVLALVGSAVAGIAPDRRFARPLGNLVLESVNRPGLLVTLAPIMQRFFAPSWGLVLPRYSAPPLIVPVPPVCAGACMRLPVQGIAQ